MVPGQIYTGTQAWSMQTLNLLRRRQGERNTLNAVEENVVKNERKWANTDVELETMDIYGTVELEIMLLVTYPQK